jgi:CxxC motif-containing protein (DUF1111 family)
MSTRPKPRFTLVLTLSLLFGCSSDGTTVPEAGSDPAREPGLPLENLTPEERSRFVAGEAAFNRVFTPADGLGPLFNENQCSACHTDPAPGGTGEQLVIKATAYSQTGCDVLADGGGPNIRRKATPALQDLGINQETGPETYTERARFTTPFVFGLGLADAVPVETLEGLADPDDGDGDGISGRLGRTADGRVGRFGRKADEASVRDFVAGAFHLEMGVTNPVRPEPELLNGQPLPEGVDPTPEPEIGQDELDLTVDFVRFLAPPARLMPEDEEGKAAVARGEALFLSLGCTSCHVPELMTGSSEVAALDRVPARLYSDFLLHDMGPDLVGTCGPGAAPQEYRTEPLAGLGRRRIFLHDGRTRSLAEAIGLHGGEGATARDAFQGLDRVTQEDLLRFLRSL